MSQAVPEIREAPEGAERRPVSQETAAALVSDMVGAPEEQPAEPTAEAPQPDPQPDPEPEPEPLDLTEDDELNAYLDEPDENDVTDEELFAETEQPDEFGPFEGVPDDEHDPRVLEERRARIAAEKKAAHYEQLRARDAQSAWKAEALKAFPLSEHVLDSIKATSKKAFLRAARDEHNRIKPHLERYRERLTGTVVEEAEQIFDEARTEAAAQYGKPTAGPSTAAEDTAEYQQKLEAAREEARKTGSIKNILKVKLTRGREG